MINLLPPAIKEQNKYAHWNVQLVQYTFLVIEISLSLAAVLIFGVVVVSKDENSLEKTIGDKEQVLSQLEPELDQAKALADKINMVGKLMDKEIKFSQLIQDIAKLVPNGASLTGLSLTGDAERPLQIEAKLANKELAPVFRANLESSDLFSLADIQSVSVGDTSGARILNYRVAIVVQFADLAQKEASP